jgi:hypothetical protein
MRLPVKNSPIIKGNQNYTPLRLDSGQNPRLFREKARIIQWNSSK